MPIFAGTGSVINFNSDDVTLTHDTDKLILSGGVLVVTGSNGKLGIQTGAPISELDVAGKIAITAEMSGSPAQPADGQGYIYTKTDGHLYWRSYDHTETSLSSTTSATHIADADADTKIHCEEAGDEDKIRFDTAGSERMIITEAGRVGIGTSAPDQPLHVQTNNNNSDPSVLIDNDNAGGTCGIGFRSGVSDNYVIGVAKTGTNFRIANGTNLSTAPSIMDLARDNGGRVGIGTTDPQVKLDIKTDTGEGNLASIDAGQGTVAIFQRNSANQSADICILAATAGQSTISFADHQDQDVGMIAYDHGVNRLGFRVAGVGDRMVIDSSGRVGIGVNNPDQELEVSGAIHISKEQSGDPAAPSDGDGGILFTKADGKIYWRSNEVATAVDLTTGSDHDKIQDADGDTHIKVEATTDADTIVMTSAGSQRMLIDNLGNVRFGTGAPSNVFEVQPDSDQTIVLGRAAFHSTTSDTMTLGHYDHRNNTGFAIQQDGSGGTKINAKSGSTVQLQISGATKATLDASGNFCIGGATGIAKLDVAGAIAITSESSSPDAPADGKGFLYTKAGGSLYWRSYDFAERNLLLPIAAQDTDADTKITLEAAADEDVIRFHLGKASGNEVMTLSGSSTTAYALGIGTNQPSGMFHIKGQVVDTAASGFEYSRLENTTADTLSMKSKSATVTISGGGGAGTVAAFFKAGMIVQAVKVTVLTVPVGGNLSLLGFSGQTDFLGDYASRITSGGSVADEAFDTPDINHCFTADTALAWTATAGLSAGQIRVTVYYYEMT